MLNGWTRIARLSGALLIEAGRETDTEPSNELWNEWHYGWGQVVSALTNSRLSMPPASGYRPTIEERAMASRGVSLEFYSPFAPERKEAFRQICRDYRQLVERYRRQS